MKSLVDKNLISAQEKELKGKNYRVVKIDNKPMIITCDFNLDRLNLEIENGIIVNVYEG